MARQKWNPRMKPRIVVVFYAMVLFVGYLAYNLVSVQAQQNKKLQGIAMQQHVGVLALPALRGAITDRNRQVLAASLTMPSVAGNPREFRKVKDFTSACLFLSKTLGVSESEVRQMMSGRGTFVWLARKVPQEVADRIESENKPTAAMKDGKLPGIFILREPTGKRFYPKGRLGVHILGYTGIDDNGLDGIEAVLDPSLKGKPGRLEAEMDRDGRVIPGGWSRRVPAQPGHTIVLTIDESIQYTVERELAKVVKEQKAKGACCVVLDVKTGDVLAMANMPDYSTRDFAHVPASLRKCRAITDSYEPGSTFKIVLAAAALDCGKIGFNESFYCGSSIMVDGWQINNADDGASSASGAETLKEIITYSFNVGTTSVALKMGRKTYFDYICKFGFGETTGLPLPGETEGIVQPLKDWANVTLATNSFGQGIAVTPIQLASAMQTIANKGVMMKPRLVKEILSADGKVVRSFPPSVRRRVISEATSFQMREILRNVVEKGTGKRAEIPGYPVAGKTGTAQVVAGGGYAGGRYIASFVGFTPVHDPRIVAIIKVEEPSNGAIWGGVVAAPVFKAIAKDIVWRLGVQPVMLQTAKVAEPKED